MQATDTQLSASSNWLTVATLCAATCIVGMLVIRELRVAPQAFATSRAAVAVAAPQAIVPPEAVSIPTLVLSGQELRVGDLATEVIARLDAAAKLAGTSNERGPVGWRQVRSYELDGTNFIVVLEPFDPRGPMRLAAIYLQ